MEIIGKYFRNVDEKNRVFIPRTFRNALGQSFYLTLGPDFTLELRSKNDFEKWKGKILNQNFLSKKLRMYARFTLGNSERMILDKQGRIVIPNHFLIKTKITKEVVLIGVGDKVEILSLESYTKFEDKFNQDSALDELTETLHKDGVKI